MSTRRSGARRRLAIATVVAVALAGACSSGDDTNADDESGDGLEQAGDGGGTGTTAEAAPLPDGYEGYTSDLYADDANWLCRPGKADDVCARDLDATVVNADGSTEVVVTVLNQAARLTSTCRVFAPVYRQVTLSGIGGDADAPEGVDPRAVAYGDVLDAFRQYVANESDGRGFVLIGHSQGSGHLTALIADEIDGEPALQDRLVGAYLLGSGVSVPEGELVGGSFQ